MTKRTQPVTPRGRPASPEMVRMLVRVPRALYDRIEQARARDDRSRDVWCRRALEAALKEDV